jgi:hypothetical protein
MASHAGALRWYRNLKTAPKLVTAFLVIVALAVVVGVVAVSRLGAAYKDTERMYGEGTRAVELVGEMRENLQKSRASAYRDLLLASPQEKEAEEKAARDAWAKVDSSLAEYKTIVPAERSEDDDVRAFEASWGPYRDGVANRLFPLS